MGLVVLSRLMRKRGVEWWERTDGRRVRGGILDAEMEECVCERGRAVECWDSHGDGGGEGGREMEWNGMERKEYGAVEVEHIDLFTTDNATALLLLVFSIEFCHVPGILLQVCLKVFYV